MNHLFDPLVHHPLKTLVKALCVALIVTGCGGGGTSGSATKTSFASGPITGLGSIYVNGVRYDDSSAKVSSEDDDSDLTLKPGMFVEVEASGSSSDGSGRSGTASEIRFGSEIVGPVGAVADIKFDATNGTGSFTLLGQTVKFSVATTSFDNSLPSGHNSITSGTVIEVHGIFNPADGNYTATRIEAESSATHFKLRGAISDLDVPPDTFKIGTELISYAALKPLSLTLSNDQVVRVKLDPTKVDGQWVATKIKSGVRKMSDHDEAEVKGLLAITTVSGNPDTYTYKVGDASFVLGTGVTFPTGAIHGAYVEVEGRVVGGVFTASKIELEDESSSGYGEFEFKDKIASLAKVPNSSDAAKFTVKGMTIRVDATTEFTPTATRANIADTACVEVKAVHITGSNELLATLIKFDDSCR